MWRKIILVIVISVLLVWVVGSSSSFQECVRNSENNQSRQAPKKSSTNLSIIVVYKDCFGEFLNDNGVAITALATIIIAYFTFTLWKATSQLGKMAVKQDGRMRESVRISKNAMKLSEAALVADRRAFVFATGLHPQYEQIPNTVLYRWRFRPIWQNSGDTPTKNMSIYVECLLRDTTLPRGFDFTHQNIGAGTGLIPPKTTLFGGVAPTPPQDAITPQDILEIQEGRKFLYIFGWTKYFDVFPGTPEHITRFCWMIPPVGDPMNFKPGSETLEEQLTFPSIHHTEGNCADEECDQKGA